MNMEAATWTWIYTGIAVGVISILSLLLAIWFENKDKK